MRKLLLAFLLLASYCPASFAQSKSGTLPAYEYPPAPIAGSYRFRLDSLLTALNKSQVPTGILYDRVAPLARLDVFGQTAADTSRFEHFLQANQELWYASYRSVGVGSSLKVRARAAQQQQAGMVPLGVLHYRFNLLDTLAVENNLFSQPDGAAGALYDVAGRPQSPYLTRETLVAAALVASVPAGTVQFVLPTALLFDNTGNAVQSLTLNFNDGSAAATLLPDGAGVSKSYPVAGEHVVQLTVHFANGSSKVTFTRLFITGQATLDRGSNPDFPIIPPCNPMVDERVPLTASISYADYDGRTYAGFGEVTTYFANCNNRQLTKPVIMLDGIEFGGPEQRYGKQVYSNFLNYYERGIPKRLGQELRAEGNDVLILDFPDNNGAEYIQRNAFLLIQLIQNVNADLRSRSSKPEKLTIIGPSMGGLVSRYALAYMEKKFNDASDPATYQKPEWNHNTRLWLSFDSPQLGANIPIGDQQWLRYYAEIFEADAAKENLKNLDTPASKEILVHHYRSTLTDASGSNVVAGAPGFRDRFQTELDNLGMPAQLRRIAVVNGSLAGVRQDWLNSSRTANGCDQAFSFEAKTGSIRLFYIKFLTINPLIPTPLSSSFVRFSPDYGQQCNTFYGTGLLKATRREFTIGRPGSIGYDVAPGSWRATQADLAGEGTGTNQLIRGKKLGDIVTNISLGGLHRPSQTTRFYDVVGKHCFIPTVSALALTNPNRDLGQNLSTTNLVCSAETPFDSYFAPLQNEEHITITAANALYIKDEIGRRTPVPVFTAAPTALCPNGATAEFSVADCPPRPGQPGTTYTWTPGNGLTIVSGQGTPSVTVASINGYLGFTTLQVVATRTGYAPSLPLTTSVAVSNGGAVSFERSTTEDVCISTTVSVLVSGATVTNWRVDNGRLLSVFGGEATVEVSGSPGITTVHADYDSACPGVTGLSASVDFYVVDGQNGVPCAARQTGEAAGAVYPNPADAYVDVRHPFAADRPCRVELYNDRGRRVHGETVRASAVRLDTRALPAGLYHLTLRQGNQTRTYNLRVQH
jgi:hypothetical protein